MNKQLELFLNHCELAYVFQGKLIYSTPLWTYFDCPRYAEGEGVKRDEGTELYLTIEVDKTGAIACEINAVDYDTLDRIEFSMVNATIPNIEAWVLTANKNLDKPYEAPESPSSDRPINPPTQSLIEAV